MQSRAIRWFGLVMFRKAGFALTDLRVRETAQIRQRLFRAAVPDALNVRDLSAVAQ